MFDSRLGLSRDSDSYLRVILPPKVPTPVTGAEGHRSASFVKIYRTDPHTGIARYVNFNGVEGQYVDISNSRSGFGYRSDTLETMTIDLWDRKPHAVWLTPYSDLIP